MEDGANGQAGALGKSLTPLVLKHPISDDFQNDFSIVQYADDTLLVLPGDARTLFSLKGLLRSFSDSTGLHVNFSKSFLIPINMGSERATHLANTFGCQVGDMPFTYLGLPLGTKSQQSPSLCH